MINEFTGNVINYSYIKFKDKSKEIIDDCCSITEPFITDANLGKDFIALHTTNNNTYLIANIIDTKTGNLIYKFYRLDYWFEGSNINTKLKSDFKILIKNTDILSATIYLQNDNEIKSRTYSIDIYNKFKHEENLAILKQTTWCERDYDGCYTNSNEYKCSHCQHILYSKVKSCLYCDCKFIQVD